METGLTEDKAVQSQPIIAKPRKPKKEKPKAVPDEKDERPDPLDEIQERFARVDTEEARIILELVRTLRHFKIRTAIAEGQVSYRSICKQVGRLGELLHEARKANKQMREELRRLKGRKPKVTDGNG